MVNDNASSQVRVYLENFIAGTPIGERLPTVRSLTAKLGVSPTTVRTAVSELVQAGRIETIPGSGTFVAQPRQRQTNPSTDHSWQTVALGTSSVDIDLLSPLHSPTAHDTIDLASGYPDPTLQAVNLLTRSMRAAARRPGTFGWAPSGGIGPLQDWFATELSPTGQHDVLIVSGGQQALSLAFRSLGNQGDAILVENPTYIGAIAAARAAGLEPTPVPIDRNGVLVDQLETTARKTQAKLLYIQPRFHNPTGANLSKDRRGPLMEVAARHNMIVVEDDWLFDLDDPKSDRHPLAANDPDGHVVHIRSLTKSVAPAVRIAGIAATGAIARRLRRSRGVEDFFVSPILQETALGVVTSATWKRHLSQLRSTLAQRRAALIAGVNKISGWEPTIQGEPLHLWLDLPSNINPECLRNAAQRNGVAIVTGAQWHAGDPSATHIRLSCAAAPTPQLEEGLARLANAFRSLTTDA